MTMRVQDVSRFIEPAPSRGGLALGLAMASRVARVRKRDLESSDPALLDVVDRAIELAWSWLGGQDVRAAELYGLFDRLAVEEGNLAEGVAKDILVAVGYALGMLVTQAYVIDRERGLVTTREIPGDLSDFTAKDLQFVYDTAYPLLGAEADAVIQRCIERITAVTAGYSAADLGPGLGRERLEG